MKIKTQAIVIFFKSYLIDPFNRIFFSTQNYLGGDGNSSKLVYCDILNLENAENEFDYSILEIIFEEKQGIHKLIFNT